MLIPLRLSAQTDEQLMQRAAHGSDRAFEELYKRHARRLQGFFARRLGGEVDLAADFMHDAFLRLYDALREVLRRLPEEQAMLFSLHYEEELTIPQIAQIASLPEGTVKSRLHKTMNIIKQQLKQYEDR